MIRIEIDKSLLIKAPTAADQIAEAKSKALATLNAEYTDRMAKLQDGWPDYEIKTWTLQADEAKAWKLASADSKPQTPFLTQLWNDRVSLGWDEPFEDLIERVLTNNTNYTSTVARYTAIRHVAERNIGNSTDPASVTWDFG